MITLEKLFEGEKHIFDRLTRCFAEIEQRLDNVQTRLEMLENHIDDLECLLLSDVTSDDPVECL